MDSESTFRKVIEKIYAAATDPALWPACLESIDDAVNACGTALTLHDFLSQSGHISYQVRFDQSLGVEYDKYYAHRNPYMLQGDAELTPGRVLSGDMILPFDQVRKTEYYNEYFAPAGWRHMLGGTLHEEGGAKSILTCLRPSHRSPFGTKEIKLLQSLMPHLRSAMQIHCRLAGARLREQVLLGALDSMRVGFVMLDTYGKPILFNKSCQAVFKSNDGLAIGKNGIVASLHRQTNEIEWAVHRASQRDAGAATVVVTRPSARRPYVLLIAPVGQAPELQGKTRAAVMVLITDPEINSGHRPDSAVLSRLFGFTPAECRIATSIFQGRSVHQAAQELHISMNTARTHLKHLFDKTDTHRQAQLIKVLTSF